MTDNSLVGKLEALLFIAPMGVTSTQLAEALQVSKNKVEDGISELLAHYTSHGRDIGTLSHAFPLHRFEQAAVPDQIMIRFVEFAFRMALSPARR